MIQEKILSYAATFLNKKYTIDLCVAPAFRDILSDVGAPFGAEVNTAFVFHVVHTVFTKHNRICPIVATPFPYVLYLNCFPYSYKVTRPYYSTKKEIATIDFAKMDCSAELLRPGDIFLTRNDNGQYHIGFIKQVSANYIISIEAVSNKIAEKRRYFQVLSKVVRLS